jgi:SAM-dependent methyltransferase
LPPGARTSPSTQRNRAPILAVLRPRLAGAGRVLEVASGAGEHAVFLAQAMPQLSWTPSDRDDLTSIAAWRSRAGLKNLAQPIPLDACAPATWPKGPFEAVVCVNMIHIAPWAACQGLMALAGKVLAPGGRLFLYGPFLEANVATAPGNLAFDLDLKARNPAWGIRQLADVAEEARLSGLRLAERIEMPANNLTVVFAKA